MESIRFIGCKLVICCFNDVPQEATAYEVSDEVAKILDKFNTDLIRIFCIPGGKYSG